MRAQTLEWIRAHARAHAHAGTDVCTHTHTCTRTCAHPIMTHCCFVHGSRDFPHVFCSWLSCFFTCCRNEALVVVGSIFCWWSRWLHDNLLLPFKNIPAYSPNITFLAVDVWTHSNPLDTRTHTRCDLIKSINNQYCFWFSPSSMYTTL